ncbi:MAG: hypothetical protein WCE21_00830 [Candidatus Babeliales bacterium]
MIVLVLFNCIVSASDTALELTTFKDYSATSFDTEKINQLSDNQKLLLRTVFLPSDIQKIIVEYASYETEEEFKKKLEYMQLQCLSYSLESIARVPVNFGYCCLNIESPIFRLATNMCGELTVCKKPSWLLWSEFRTVYTSPECQTVYKSPCPWLNQKYWQGVCSLGWSANQQKIVYLTRTFTTDGVEWFMKNGTLGVTQLLAKGMSNNAISITDTIAKKIFERQFVTQDDLSKYSRLTATNRFFPCLKNEQGYAIEKMPGDYLGISNDALYIAMPIDKKIIIFPFNHPDQIHSIDAAEPVIALNRSVTRGYLFFNKSKQWLGRIVLDLKNSSRHITVLPLPYQPEQMAIAAYFKKIGVCKDLMAQIKDWVE